jgi:hypothetical protein
MIKESKILFFFLVAIAGILSQKYQFAAIIMSLGYLYNLVSNSNNYIAFREFTLVMYSLNYLFSPAILYNYNDADFLYYKMNCSIELYFVNAFIGVLSLHIGMFFFKTDIFKTDFKLLKVQAILNDKVLKNWTIGGLLLHYILLKVPMPAEIGFFILLLSALRYIGFFGLIVINPKKHLYLLLVVGLYEFYVAISGGFFHDLLIWMSFLGLFLSYYLKITLRRKILFGFVFIFLAFIIQNVKGDYRDKIWKEEQQSSTTLFADVVSDKTSDSKTLYSKENILSTLIRINQGWITASTIDYTDRYHNFAGTEVLELYIESALLPRFLAPNKLNSGDKQIFNKYSGHTINAGTSMGLGVIADGYVAYGTKGVGFFCFGLGLIFCGVFKIVGNWSKTSPFFMFMLFPILYYAVRPDCELQTTLGHIVKGTFAYFLVVRYYRNYFKVKLKAIIQSLDVDKKLILKSQKEVLV